MEPSDFAGWLTALSSLKAAQRRIVFRELALAEADDPCEEGVEISVPGPAAADADWAEKRGDASATAFCGSGARDIFREIAKECQSARKRDPLSASKRDPFRSALGMTVRRADVARVNLGRSRAAERLPGVQ